MFLVETKLKTFASVDLKGLIFSFYFLVTKHMGSKKISLTFKLENKINKKTEKVKIHTQISKLTLKIQQNQIQVQPKT